MHQLHEKKILKKKISYKSSLGLFFSGCFCLHPGPVYILQRSENKVSSSSHFLDAVAGYFDDDYPGHRLDGSREEWRTPESGGTGEFPQYFRHCRVRFHVSPFAARYVRFTKNHRFFFVEYFLFDCLDEFSRYCPSETFRALTQSINQLLNAIARLSNMSPFSNFIKKIFFSFFTRPLKISRKFSQ